MKKASVKKLDDALRPEYDLSQLKGGVRGKYYRQAAAGTNLMLIEPELAEVFRDAESGTYEMVMSLVRPYSMAKGRAIAEKYFWKNSVAAYRWLKREGAQPRLA